ncbi:type VI secretion system protein ImpK [Paraburkholderia sp. UCT70]|uniref:type IVB secretion system protein IcmH/DotU n=1 Tax=Paraburkholderia sp. UCT70 TaxID=2991068 RepID=UPI003D1FB178
MNTTNDRSADATRRGDATMVRPQRAVNGDPNADPNIDPNIDPNTDAGDVTRIVRPASPTSRVMPANRPSQPPGPPPLRAELGDFLSGVANPLVRAANPLLLLTVQLRHSVAPPTDVGRLREQAVAQVRSFERYAQGAGIDTQTIVAARYVLCTMLDESVNNAPWGDLSGWAQKTLLVTFHGEAYGGAKFFQILDRLSVDFSRHLDLIELMYICLALGFGGRYLVEPGGLARLADIQDDLYRRIRGLREAPASELAPHWRGVEDRRNPVMRHVPMWVAASAAAVVLLGAFLVFFTKLNALAAPVGAQLAAIGLENTPPPQTVATPAPTAARVTLKQLLAPQEQAGQLSVDEQTDGRDTVRLAAAELFPSGGADIAPDVGVAPAPDHVGAESGEGQGDRRRPHRRPARAFADLQGQLRAVDGARAEHAADSRAGARRSASSRSERRWLVAADRDAGRSAGEPHAQPSRGNPVYPGALNP